MDSLFVLYEPRMKVFCMVPTGIVYNDNHFAAFTMTADKAFHVPLKSHGIKSIGTFGNKSSISDTNCPENPYVLSGRRMQDNGVLYVRSNPHGAARTVLLEMALILKPQVKVFSFG